MISSGNVGGLTPSKLLVRPTFKVIARPSTTDADCRVSSGSSQLLPLPLLHLVWLFVSLSSRRRPLTRSLSRMCLCWSRSPLSLQWLDYTFRSYQPCSIWTWPWQTSLFYLLRLCPSSRNKRIATSESNSESSYFSGLVCGRSSFRFWYSIKAYSTDSHGRICMHGGRWSALSL